MSTTTPPFLITESCTPIEEGGYDKGLASCWISFRTLSVAENLDQMAVLDCYLLKYPAMFCEVIGQPVSEPLLICLNSFGQPWSPSPASPDLSGRNLS